MKELTISIDFAIADADLPCRVWTEGTAITTAAATGTFAAPSWGDANYIGRVVDAPSFGSGSLTDTYEFVNPGPAVAAAADPYSFSIETVRFFPGIFFSTEDIAFKGGSAPEINMEITFMGASTTGDQYGLECRANQCSDGCQPRLHRGIKWHNSSDISSSSAAECNVGEMRTAKSANLECSGRGRCDYGSGICECFTGYTDEYCSTQSALI